MPLIPSVHSIEQDFLQYVREMVHLQEVMNLLFWDTKTGAPMKGMEQRSELIGTISSKRLAMSTSPEMKAYLDELSEEHRLKELSDTTKKILKQAKKEYDQNSKIPPAEYKEYVILRTNAGRAWEIAKDKNDFSVFQSFLEKLVDYNKRFTSYWGYEGNRYNALLDLYDPGMTVEILDGVFAKLKEHIVPLLHRVMAAKEKPDTGFLYQSFSKENQKKLHSFLLHELGYDFESGRLDETVHPFAITINRDDVRITTKYEERDFMSGLLGTIHEFGHALYEMNISNELIGTTLCEGTSAGIHESQSLFWEKFIGRHINFWKRYLPYLKQYNPDQFDRVQTEEFYRAIHTVKPSFIRIKADELTYPLHIIIRYEIEKGLFNDQFEVKDLPEIWKQKMVDYLGIIPPDDANGVLQDMHWSAGMFGQFPSYALGYLYAAQFQSAMVKDLGEWEHLIESGHFGPIREWLVQKIHVHGKMKEPHDLLLEVTGENLNPIHLITYLEKKYSDIYKL